MKESERERDSRRNWSLQVVKNGSPSLKNVITFVEPTVEKEVVLEERGDKKKEHGDRKRERTHLVGERGVEVQSVTTDA